MGATSKNLSSHDRDAVTDAIASSHLRRGGSLTHSWLLRAGASTRSTSSTAEGSSRRRQAVATAPTSGLTAVLNVFWTRDAKGPRTFGHPRPDPATRLVR